MDQLWADFFEDLKSVVAYNDFLRFVAPLVANCSVSGIELVAPSDEVRERAAALVIPPFAERFPSVPLTVSVQSPATVPDQPPGSAQTETRRPGLWARCLAQLATELPEAQFNTWVRALQAIEGNDTLKLLAPNRFVVGWIENNLYERLQQLVVGMIEGKPPEIILEVGSRASTPRSRTIATPLAIKNEATVEIGSRLSDAFTFDRFVEGQSNKIARSIALQVAHDPGRAYNPLFIYGGVGLGKTHLMHAIGNQILVADPTAKVAYVHSERFVSDMVRALQHNMIAEFKRAYRSRDALLIDDIQFFAGKERSQEEFFHTFNALLEGQRQVILTCDRYPKEVMGLEERLKSRFGSGLTVAIEQPEVETSVAILLSKAAAEGETLPEDVALFLAQRIRSNVRELEGALRRVLANARFTDQPITLEFTKDALRDVLALQDKLITIENIQKTVAEYCKVSMHDLLSKRRDRSIARPRQIAMALGKELTTHSLPEIGDAFGGRDHGTVLHACKTIKRLRETDNKIRTSYEDLLRMLQA